MAVFKKLKFVWLGFALALSACNVQISLNSKPTAGAASSSFKKILFIEEADDATTDFYNNLRKDIRREMLKSGVQTEFARKMPDSENNTARVEAARQKLQPEAVVKIAHVIERQRGKWGPLRRSVRQITAKFDLVPVGSEATTWSAELWIQSYYGVDVPTDRAATLLRKKMLEDGLIR